MLSSPSAQLPPLLDWVGSMGNINIIQLLLDRGAPINALDRWGGTPLRDAVREGHVASASKLREAGGEPAWPDIRPPQRH